MGSNAYTDSRFIDHSKDTKEDAAITDLRETMADKAARQEEAEARHLAGTLPNTITDQVTNEILCYARSFGQPLYLSFAVRVALVLQDRGLLADE